MAEVLALKTVDRDALVLSQQDGAILRLTLNNPPANALSMATKDGAHVS